MLLLLGLVQSDQFIVGPAVGDNTATGGVLGAGVKPDGTNTFKISASCNGADQSQFAGDTFQFFVVT